MPSTGAEWFYPLCANDYRHRLRKILTLFLIYFAQMPQCPSLGPLSLRRRVQHDRHGPFLCRSPRGKKLFICPLLRAISRICRWSMLILVISNYIWRTVLEWLAYTSCFAKATFRYTNRLRSALLIIPNLLRLAYFNGFSGIGIRNVPSLLNVLIIKQWSYIKGDREKPTF